jgi:HSP20 family molecular chaperone IbpA
MSFFNALIPTFNSGRAEGEAAPARRPQFQVNETDAAYCLTVNLPGVAKEGLEITDEGGELRITGARARALPDDSSVLHRESSDAAFELVLAHDNTIDSEKIGAELKDGVLHLTLAKAESAKPRKISIG